MNKVTENKRLLRLPEVKRKTGLSRSTIYLKIKEGTFPKGINLGGRSVAWIEDEIDNWIAERVSASRQTLSNSGR